jgi:hypothetical protein
MATQTTTAPAAADVQRKDAWWISPLTFFVVFGLFGAWATFRAFQNNYYEVGNYLSPFYAPTIQLGMKIAGYEISPALLILPFPLTFRLTCYYYRKMIYRSYLFNPAGCAVNRPLRAPWIISLQRYWGEKALPFVVMNFHRYAFYAAVIFIVLLWYDAIKAFFFAAGNGVAFGIGVGSLVFLTNVILLSCYTFSCHSFRHLIGGNTDCYSCSALTRSRYGLWQKVSYLNDKHGLWAMMSLVSVGLTDVYVYLLATHTINDIRFF